MFEKYTSVYMAPTAFTNIENFLNFLNVYMYEIVNDRCKLSIAPETRLFVDSMTREGLISPLVKHQINNYKVFKVCLDVQCYSLRECLVEDAKNGKILVVIGESAYPDLYVGITGGVDIAEITERGNLQYKYCSDDSNDNSGAMPKMPELSLDDFGEVECVSVSTTSVDVEGPTLKEQMEEIFGPDPEDDMPETMTFDSEVIKNIRASLLQIIDGLEGIIRIISTGED